MRASSGLGLAAIAVTVVIGCGKKDATARPDPAPSTTASATVAPVPTVTATATALVDDRDLGPAPAPPYECFDEQLRTSLVLLGVPKTPGGPAAIPSTLGPPTGDTFGYGGLGIHGTGAGGGDIVDAGPRPGSLGALPPTGLGYGGSRSLRTDPRVVGDLIAPRDVAGLPVARRLCAANPALRTCTKAASAGGTPLRAKATYAIEVRGDGAVIGTRVIAGAIADATLDGCFARAFAALTFPAGTPTIHYELAIGPDAPHSASLVEKTLTVTGGLPREVVRRIVRARYPALRACYEAQLRTDPTATGTLSTTLTIDATGKTVDAKSEVGTLTDPTTRGCVRKVFEDTAWPEPAAGTVAVTFEADFRVE